MPAIVVLNLNLDPAETQGCARIAAALAELGPHALTLDVVPFAALAGGAIGPCDGLVLGPQGTPFSRYDGDFLPWLRGAVETFSGPVLGVCGGMQALALAWGGALGSVSGAAVGTDYAGLYKVRGPLHVTLHPADLPVWLPLTAHNRLAGWDAAGAKVFESHVEHLTRVPAEFAVVASSAESPVEAIAHRKRPIWASQFHPESGWDAGCGSGQLWLAAWLDVLAATVRAA
ncbi:MAG: hypothetical protein EXR79_01020 [Myxococcales bacterium]|nr:hypothetical protein [Myxococcales bacterium]